MACQCHWSAVPLAPKLESLWDGNDAGCFPHHRDLLTAEAQGKEPAVGLTPSGPTASPKSGELSGV